MVRRVDRLGASYRTFVDPGLDVVRVRYVSIYAILLPVFIERWNLTRDTRENVPLLAVDRAHYSAASS